MKVLVTGACGYLGLGVVKQLCDDGFDVVASCLETIDELDSRVTVIEGDIFEMENPFETFGEPDVLCHLAWRNGFCHNDSCHIDDLPKHFSFVEKMIKGGCKQIAVMGTMHEIGFFEGAVNANTPAHPENLYGISKNALREAVRHLCKQYDVLFQWMRGFYIVGESANGSSIFSKIVIAEKQGKTLFPFTLGENQCDFIDYKDCCKQIASVVEQKEVVGIINICSGHPEKLKNVVEAFIHQNRFNIKLDYGKYPDRPYDSKAIWGDNEKIRIVMNKRQSKLF